MVAFTNVSPTANITSVGAFIPELWSDEIIAKYKANLVVANLVRKLSMKGKKGDVIHVPKPTRNVASKKIAETAVTLSQPAATELLINIDQHYQYSVLIEDIAETQALPSMRRFFTDDAGYALAKQVDSDLLAIPMAFGTAGSISADPLLQASWENNGTYMVTGAGATSALTAYTAAGTPAVLGDGAVRHAVQLLDDQDVPMDNRSWVIHPAATNSLRAIDQYMDTDFVNEKGKVTGKLGTIYGVEFFQTTNVWSTTTGADRMTVLFHKDAMVLAEQVGVRTQTQYMQEQLATLMTADRIYGRQVYRPEAGIVVALP